MSAFERRYLITGRLSLTTALHVGGGRGSLSASDSPVVRTQDGRPFIPGSSLKGAFRSAVERLAGAIPGVWTCALAGDAGCPGAAGAAQRVFNAERRGEGPSGRAAPWDEPRLLRELDQRLCDTCKLFGSPYMASKLAVYDLYP